VQYILAMRREVNLNVEDDQGMTPIDCAKEDFPGKKKNCTEIVELLESFERNPNETRTKLRMQLGFPGKLFYLIFYFFFFYINFFQILILILILSSFQL